MSIAGRTGRGEDITEPVNALRYFTNREAAIEVFCRFVNDEPPRASVLFFHGAAGVGKSLLLRHLQAGYCHWLDRADWAALHHLHGREFVAEFERRRSVAGALPAPVTLLNFADPAVAPTDMLGQLLALRRQLGPHRLACPLFDFAVTWYLYQQGRRPAEEVKRLLPTDAADLVAVMIDAASGTAVGALAKAAFGVMGKRADDGFRLAWARRGLSEADLRAIQALPLDGPLLDALPRLLAEDLSAALATHAERWADQWRDTPPRLALLFDTHEAFWGSQLQPRTGLASGRDAWLRRLLSHLRFEHGLVAVVAGRDEPRWPELDDEAIPAEFLTPQRLGDLAPEDARRYLRLVAVPADLHEPIVAEAGADDGAVHPFRLGLWADLVRAAARRGEPLTAATLLAHRELERRESRLLERFLGETPPEIRSAIEALSACRQFDEALYSRLGQALGFAATPANFGLLTSFSCVDNDRARPPRHYWLHDLVREIHHDQAAPLTQRAHPVLEPYYRERAADGDDAALVEAIYHANRVDAERGAGEWVETFERAMRRGQYAQCEALRSIRPQLVLPAERWRGRMALQEGEYAAFRSRHREARDDFNEAIMACDHALQQLPDDFPVLIDRANALKGLADLLAQMSDYGEARRLYEQAIAAHEAVSRAGQINSAVLNNRGTALRGLADLQAHMSEYTSARERYEEAMATFDAALRLSAPASQIAQIFNNQGTALAKLAFLLARMSEHASARERYEQAVRAYDAALHLVPDNFYALNNKGGALQCLADLLARLSKHDEARAWYQQAIATYDAALRLAPDHLTALNNKGVAIRSLADLLANLGIHDEAQSRYEEAVDVYDAALMLAPDYLSALTNNGDSLQRLAYMLAHLSQYAEAQERFGQAVAAYDAALDLAPDAISALNGRGLALHGLAGLLNRQGKHDEARTRYEEALAPYDAVLRLAPDDYYALSNKCNTLASLAELLVQLGEYSEAHTWYLHAIAGYDASLQLASNNPTIFNNKGNVLSSLADLLTQLSENTEARDCYQQAIATLDTALRLAPDYLYAHYNRGLTLRSLGDLQHQIGETEEAMASWQAALTSLDHCLRTAPNAHYAREARDETQRRIDGARANQAELEDDAEE